MPGRRANNLTPVLARRNAERLPPLAGEMGLEAGPSDLDDSQKIASLLENTDVLLHCAGPHRGARGCLRAP